MTHAPLSTDAQVGVHRDRTPERTLTREYALVVSAHWHTRWCFMTAALSSFFLCRCRMCVWGTSAPTWEFHVNIAAHCLRMCDVSVDGQGKGDGHPVHCIDWHPHKALIASGHQCVSTACPSPPPGCHLVHSPLIRTPVCFAFHPLAICCSPRPYASVL